MYDNVKRKTLTNKEEEEDELTKETDETTFQEMPSL